MLIIRLICSIRSLFARRWASRAKVTRVTRQAGYSEGVAETNRRGCCRILKRNTGVKSNVMTRITNCCDLGHR
jgi:hypothetical protein